MNKTKELLKFISAIFLAIFLCSDQFGTIHAENEPTSTTASPTESPSSEYTQDTEEDRTIVPTQDPVSASSSPAATSEPEAAQTADPAPEPTGSASASPVPSVSPTPVPSSKPIVVNDPGIAMYRLYNPNSGEHFYTSNWTEASNVIQAGWRSEGIGWYAPSSGNDVYRLYNRNGGEHHYTLNKNERDHLVRLGWKYEGVGWKSGGKIALHREYNPNAYANNHNYTTSGSEHKHLVSLGWRDEGIAWYATGTAADMMRGIDISEWQNDIDLRPYMGQFVIIRAGYDWSDNPSAATAENFISVDKRFVQNVQKCEKLGIPYGIYWFSEATNAEEARKEAETFYYVTRNYNPALGFWMDEEGDNWKNKHHPNYETRSNLTNVVNSFTSTMRKHGKKIGVYASHYWFNHYISTSCPKWVADYGNNNGNLNKNLSMDKNHYVMHQYTSNPLDKNILYVSFRDLFK